MKRGQIVYSPIENIPCILLKINDRLWSSTYSILPLSSGVFSKEGVVQEELQHQVKGFEQTIKVIKKRKPNKKAGYSNKLPNSGNKNI